MITESLIETIITASITGAGLIFVACSIIIPFSDKIKKFREVKIKDARKKLKKDNLLPN